MKDQDEPVIRKVNAYLEREAHELDSATNRRLDQFRHEAVAVAEQQSQRKGLYVGSWLTNAGYAAAFSVAVIAGLLAVNTKPVSEPDEASAFELVVANEDFDVLEQDLAFYAWLESELPEQG